MIQGLMDKLSRCQIPASTPVPDEGYLVAWLKGVDFEGLLKSPDYAFSYPFDPQFGKMVVRAACQLLGGDACGTYAQVHQHEVAVLLSRDDARRTHADALSLQGYLVALASSRLTLEVGDEAIFACSLHALSEGDLARDFFVWRQQLANESALYRYCFHVLEQEGQSETTVRAILSGMEPEEREEILRQHHIRFEDLPAWQRWGAAAYVGADGRVAVDTALPRAEHYGAYVTRFL